MGVQTSAGTTLAIAVDTSPATYDITGFAALTFNEIGEVTNIGEIMRQYQLVRHNPLKTRKTVKKKGSYDDGSLPIQFGQDIADQGQIDMETARDSDDDSSFKLTLQDGTIFYFVGIVTSAGFTPGQQDAIVGGSAQIELTDAMIPGQ